MVFTKFERNVLENTWSLREHEAILADLVRFSLKGWLVLILIIGGTSLVLFQFEFSSLAWWILGMGCGAILRDLGHCRLRNRIWPLTREITDWSRVEALLRDTTAPAEPVSNIP